MLAKFKLAEREGIKATFKINAVLTDVTEIEEKIQANKELIEEETQNRINADVQLQNNINTKQDKGDYALNSRVDGVVNAFDNEIETISTEIEELITTKADKSNTYTKGEVDIKLQNVKVDAYTKAETNNLLSQKANQSALNITNNNLDALTGDVENIAGELDGKQPKGDYLSYTQEQTLTDIQKALVKQNIDASRITNRVINRTWTYANFNLYGTYGRTESWSMGTKEGLFVGDIFTINVTISDRNNAKGYIFIQVSGSLRPDTESSVYGVTLLSATPFVPDMTTKQDVITSDNAGENIIITPVGESLLPEGYTQLEYIQSTGTQYINTGIMLGRDYTNTNIKIEYEAIINPSNNWQVCGTLGSVGIYIGVNANNTIYYGCGTNDTSTEIQNPFTKCKWINDGKNGIVKVNDINNKRTIVDVNYTPVTSTTNVPIIICGFSTNSTTVSSNKLSGNIYNFKLYNNEELIANFIPAKRNSDDVIGMYDLISNQFFINNGIGKFIAGGEVANVTKISAIIPNKTSDLINNSGFITSSYHDNAKQDKPTITKASNNQNGIIQHADGRMEQWGIATSSNTGETEFTMNNSFVDTNFQVFIEPRQAGDLVHYAIPSAKNKFKARIQNTSGAYMTCQFQWRAYGFWK